MNPKRDSPGDGNAMECKRTPSKAAISKNDDASIIVLTRFRLREGRPDRTEKIFQKVAVMKCLIRQDIAEFGASTWRGGPVPHQLDRYDVRPFDDPAFDERPCRRAQPLHGAARQTVFRNRTACPQSGQPGSILPLTQIVGPPGKRINLSG